VKLAKHRLDIGFATNPRAGGVWRSGQNYIGLPFDHTQPILRALPAARHDLCGSILKIIRSMMRCRIAAVGLSRAVDCARRH